VVGERVYQQLGWFGPADYGAFLLGFILVDVHLCSPIGRRRTRFADAVALVGSLFGGAQARLDAMVARSMEVAPSLRDRAG
jgi:hypothetical protein